MYNRDKDRKVLMDAMEAVKKMKPCMFKYEGEMDDGKNHFGFIAQDLLEIFNEEEYGIVSMHQGFHTVHYHELIPFLVMVIKNLILRVEELENVKNV